MNDNVKPLSGKKVFFYFLAFFGIIAAVNSIMITLALRTHSGTVTEHPYEIGLAYNNIVNSEEVQEKLGWKGEIAFADKQITFSLSDKNGKPVKTDSLRAHIYRPTQSGMDFDVALEQGRAEAIKFPAKGLWEVRIFALVGENKFQQVKRVVVE